MAIPPAPPARHSAGCPCRTCRPNPPLTANAIATLALAGIAAGCALAELLGWLTGAPGIRTLFGL